jgi:hypothetical protein
LADIFNEIEEDMRRDRVAQLWRRYGKLVIAAAVLIVIGTGAYVAWQNYQQSQAEKLGNRYSLAEGLLRDGNGAKAFDAFKGIAADTGQGYGLLARIQAAALQAQGKTDAAPAPGAKPADNAATKSAGLDALDGIAGDAGVGRNYRDLARLLWGFYGVDSLAKDKIVQAMQPLTIAPNPWRFTATELTALADLKSGDKPGALKLYKTLADDLDAPQTLRARAAEIVTDLQN